MGSQPTVPMVQPVHGWCALGAHDTRSPPQSTTSARGAQRLYDDANKKLTMGNELWNSTIVPIH
jgi:hypothetical protein